MRVLGLLASIALAIAVLDLVRRRRLREEFSWLWVVGALAAVVLSASQSAREHLASLLRTDARTACLSTLLLFLVLVALDISTKVSKLANQNKNLAQDLARQRKRLEELEADDE